MTPQVFLLCLAAGLVCGAADGALSPLRRRKKLYLTVLTDIIIAFVFVALHWAIIYLYTDGRVFAYAVAAQIVGYIAGRTVTIRIAKVLSRRLSARLRRRKKISHNLRNKTRSKQLQV